MAAAGGSLAQEICEEASCPICLEYFTDPVITDCGHNFCRSCITQSWEKVDSNPSCPQCREPVQQNSLRPNRNLASLVEISKKFNLQEAKEKVSAGGVCGKHQEPLKLFCKDHQTLICTVCDRSKEHREHQVIPVDEAAEEYKEKIQVQQPSLESEREKLVKQKEAEEQKKQECLKQIEKEKEKISSLFKEMHLFLEEKERCWLKDLADLEKEITNRQEENMTRLAQDISYFNDLIKELEVKCKQPPSEFLQDIEGTLNRCQEVQVRQQLKPSPGLEWRLRKCYPQSSVLIKAMEEFEGSMTDVPSKVSVTLDPDTAHSVLLVSDNLTSVRWKDISQNLPKSPKRFDTMPCVLGRDRFNSGILWWEVEVEDVKGRGCWLVGVARESLRRKEHFSICPKQGIWAVGRNLSEPVPLWAVANGGNVSLALPHEPRKILVFLDYKEGRVEFFDADTDDAIFTYCPASFSGEEIRPFFWVGEGVYLQC